MCRGIYLLMWIQPWLKVDFKLNIPREHRGLMVVSNHRSHLDAFLLLASVQGIRIQSKTSVFSIPFLGWMMRACKHIPVPRGDLGGFVKSLDVIRDRLKDQNVVFIFPEMTRCPYGMKGVNTFSVAPFHAAFQEKVPVIPLIMTGTDEAWPRGVPGLFWRKPIKVWTLPMVDTAKFNSAEDLKNEVKRQIESALA